MTRNERILKDLSANLREKILDNLSDFIDLCHCANLNERDVATEAMHLLIQISAGYAAHRFNISADDYAKAMGRHFRNAQSRLRKGE
jgi:hypothetical protein